MVRHGWAILQCGGVQPKGCGQGRRQMGAVHIETMATGPNEQVRAVKAESSGGTPAESRERELASQFGFC